MEKVDPWGSEAIDDYQGLFEDFGIEPFEKFRKHFQDNRYVRRGIIFGHRDFDRIFKSMNEKKPFAMMTGLMPSGKFHFGHKMVADQIIWYQSLGAEIFVCAADVESWLMRDVTFEQARDIAINEYLANYVALGLNPKKIKFWFQSDYRNEYYRLRDKASKRVTFNEMKAIYGELTPGKIVSVLAQIADILHPQLPEFGGPRPVVVPVGADQDPHLRLTRDAASRLNAEREMGGRDFECVPPSSTYHKFMRGLQGGKMSSSDPKSYIALSESPKDAVNKIMSAKTGGRATVDEQREKGGVPEDCTIYDLFLYHLVDDDKELEKIYMGCKKGGRICGECKANCSDMVSKFLHEHQKRLEKAKDIVKGFSKS
ncbi:MAG: tryptophan--tRNA ligase [Candidatus Altiarchaeota archaeon]|nr:tryptophan--tRNA ligase [Candidatus Altiarchaeota archaeon]